MLRGWIPVESTDPRGGLPQLPPGRGASMSVGCTRRAGGGQGRWRFCPPTSACQHTATRGRLGAGGLCSDTRAVALAPGGRAEGTGAGQDLLDGRADSEVVQFRGLGWGRGGGETWASSRSTLHPRECACWHLRARRPSGGRALPSGGSQLGKCSAIRGSCGQTGGSGPGPRAAGCPGAAGPWIRGPQNLCCNLISGSDVLSSVEN